MGNAAWDGSVPCHPYDARRLVYVEVPRAGCSSIKTALGYLLGDDVPDLGEIHRWTGYTMARDTDQLADWLTGRWAGYRRFTVVRHPVERFLSSYYGVDAAGLGDPNAWIRARPDDVHWKDIHAVPQRRIVGELALYDLVGRLEDMPAVETWLREATGDDVTMPHVNPSRAPRIPLDVESLRTLRRFYSDDLVAFGYD